jgi:Domain of unknown function (DUF4062)
MPAPTVFVSSTFYDLRYIRESLKRFIEELGYTPVLSEDGAVFYDPTTSAAESCISEIPNVQLFVLVIGGRYGSKMPSSEESVTNAEYQKAVKEKIPVFAMVEQGTYHDFQLYRHNMDKDDVVSSITFPNADSTKIFEFIYQVQSASVNNALYPFRTYGDIEAYLRSQWAGMMYSFLTKAAESMKVVDSLAILTNISERTEVIAAQILRNVGQVIDQLAVDFLQRMLVSQAVSDIRYVRTNPTPIDIVKNETFQDCVTQLHGSPYRVTEKSSTILSAGGEISASRLASSEAEYNELRDYMLAEIEKADVPMDEFCRYPFFQRDLSPAASRTKDSLSARQPVRRKKNPATSSSP